MRLPTIGPRTVRPFLAVLVIAGLAACTATPDSAPTSASPASTSASPTPSASATPTPDMETTVPAPSPPAPPAASGPGEGNAELSIMVKPSEAEPALNYTLVCQGGTPAAESQHPAAETACAALKENPALLNPSTKNTAQACTEQYGGPQQATVTGVIDGTPVDVSFARTNGCEISAWEAAEAVLGSTGGAA
jgi:hypothetical protein